MSRAEQKELEESKYPLNYVTQFDGGHRLVVSNERGKEFIRLMHPSGSYQEIQPDGKMVSFTNGESKSYTKGGMTVTVDENGDFNIVGHSKAQVSGGMHMEIAGDMGGAIAGNIALAGMGNAGFSVKGNMYMATDGAFNIHVTGAANIKADGGMTIDAPTTTINSPSITFNGDITHEGNMTTSGIHTDSIGQHDA